MAKNEFLPFGTAANANVLPNADYLALPERSSGFNSGVAKSEQLNTVWRQASVIASVVAQFIADNSGQDVLDDGNVTTLKTNLEDALMAFAGTSLDSGTNFQTMPGGMIFQWGIIQTGAAGSPKLINFQKPYQRVISSINATRTSASATDTSNSIVVAPVGLTGFNVRAREDNITAYWMAIGY
ncbi:gp53-like domain-containing protein [Serratia ureilytica]|uniref:gp53-like domain-containing protein n=1 Tax=Serratia ureilytica TaxID=300181 RepID=UPI001AA1248F|nr:hypothetical protein [Serratia ureilytica]